MTERLVAYIPSPLWGEGRVRGEVEMRVIGPYVVDVCCRERKLIVELDGGQHAAHVGTTTCS